MNPSTLVISHPDCTKHETGPNHPESAARLAALLSSVHAAIPELEGRVAYRDGRHAGEADLGLVHPHSHIARVRAFAQQAATAGGLAHIDPDTVVSPASYEAALGAAGSVLTAVDALTDGSARNAFCIVRPPGHHATADRAMGFCLFNNVAIGVRYAQEKGLQRALIIDWDVHHGNGTEAIFYENADVYFISMHQSPHYPGTGHSAHRGHGPGQATNLNLPVPPGLPATHYKNELQRGLAQALTTFSPDVIFISSGFDSAYGDPLAGLTLAPEDFHYLTEHVLEIADVHCEGRVISVLEGGYDTELLVDCGLAHIRALARLPVC
ncbi:MAG: histone deacetylase [Gemmatimonadota bacterium]|nr:MAG: histone deacetylase [Gemmatimonadota bacterium]